MKFLSIRSSVFAACVIAVPALAQAPGGEAPPPPKVTVVVLQPQDVTITSLLPGRVIASAEAELRPQVNGIVTERTFDDGTAVKLGQPLYRIDPRTYEAAVAQAEAALAQAKAQADDAKRDADRANALRDRSVVSQQNADSALAARDAAAAAVKAAQASLDAAKIDLERTVVKAPLDGVIGLALVTEGTLVTANQALPLAVIRRIDPVQVDVTQSAAEIIRWQRQGAKAALPKGVDATVTLRLADGSTYEHTGLLTGAEPHVNETTGVVTLRIEFPNPENLLLPGMYVLVGIPQARIKDAILAPQEGVTRDRRGRPIAYVVNDKNVVEERVLDIVQDQGNSWIVRDGLEANDRLIVSGFQSVATDMVVTPEERMSEEVNAPRSNTDSKANNPSNDADDNAAADAN